MARYEILEEYVHARQNDIEQGREIVLEVRDLETYERIVAKARVGLPGKPVSGGSQLILRNLAEDVVSDEWTIEILDELDPDEVTITPQSDFRRNVPDGA